MLGRLMPREGRFFDLFNHGQEMIPPGDPLIHLRIKRVQADIDGSQSGPLKHINKPTHEDTVGRDRQLYRIASQSLNDLSRFLAHQGFPTGQADLFHTMSNK